MKTAHWLTLVFGFLIALAGPTTARAARYQMPIAFPGYSNRAEALTNFPVLVVLSNAVGGSGFSYSNNPFASTNGWDLRFRDATDTLDLNYEIESWNTNGASWVWVLVTMTLRSATPVAAATPCRSACR